MTTNKKKHTILKHNKMNKTRKISKMNKTRKVNKTNKQLELLCKKLPTTFNRFEDSIIDNKTYMNRNWKKDLIKVFHTPFAPSKITPRSDYYTYINYSWILEQTKLSQKEKKFYPQIDSFRLTQEKVYYELIDIVKEYTSTNKTKKAKEIKNLYESLVGNTEKKTEYHIKEAIETIDNYIKEDDLLKFLAHINSNEIVSWGSPISWSMDPDAKNSEIYRNNISPPVLTAYDYLLYIEDTQEDQDTLKNKRIFKKKYFTFVKQIFDEIIGQDHGLNPQDVWDVEYDMLNAMGCNSIKNESEDYYNVVTTSESLSKYDFDWKQFSKYLGFKKTPEFFICSSLNYLKCITKILKENWKTKKWRTYFIYIYARQIIRFDKKGRHIFYDFFGKFMRGQPVIFPEKIYPVFVLSLCFNTFLTNEYVERNQKPENIDYVNKMAQDLLIVFKRIIKINIWLSPKTKKYALLKLEHLKFVIGSPKILREDPLLGYVPDDPWINLQKITKWRFDKFIELEGKPIIDIPTIAWDNFKLIGTQAYVVNAYYTPTQNSIYVPLAYLQKPFIDLNERGIEYNLAHIGYTLGHEMSHALDDMGSKYDYKGNLHNWWTKEDRIIFNRKINNVIKQYETFAAYDGIKMDASLSTGENLADISGLEICEEYLRDFQIKNNDITPIRALSFESFFVYIAIQARQKIYSEAIKSQLKINPHPMDKYRTNCPLARLKLFRSLYNIQKGDKMYWSSTDTIW